MRLTRIMLIAYCMNELLISLSSPTLTTLRRGFREYVVIRESTRSQTLFLCVAFSVGLRRWQRHVWYVGRRGRGQSITLPIYKKAKKLLYFLFSDNMNVDQCACCTKRAIQTAHAKKHGNPPPIRPHRSDRASLRGAPGRVVHVERW